MWHAPETPVHARVCNNCVFSGAYSPMQELVWHARCTHLLPVAVCYSIFLANYPSHRVGFCARCQWHGTFDVAPFHPSANIVRVVWQLATGNWHAHSLTIDHYIIIWGAGHQSSTSWPWVRHVCLKPFAPLCALRLHVCHTPFGPLCALRHLPLPHPLFELHWNTQY